MLAMWQHLTEARQALMLMLVIVSKYVNKVQVCLTM